MHLKIAFSKLLVYININDSAATFKSSITKLKNQLTSQSRRLQIKSVSIEESRRVSSLRPPLK